MAEQLLVPHCCPSCGDRCVDTFREPRSSGAGAAGGVGCRSGRGRGRSAGRRRLVAIPGTNVLVSGPPFAEWPV